MVAVAFSAMVILALVQQCFLFRDENPFDESRFR